MAREFQFVRRETPEGRKRREQREEKDIARRQNFAGVYLAWLSRGDTGAVGAAKAITEAHAAGRHQPGLQLTAAEDSGDT